MPPVFPLVFFTFQNVLRDCFLFFTLIRHFDFAFLCHNRYKLRPVAVNFSSVINGRNSGFLYDSGGGYGV
ncbi:hypothetical protein AYO06_09345 [Morganella morganii]|nr:hypothetical protein X965_01805 [Morganella sp. EGD-HP17]OAS00097.1 hypothetical protein AYO06_09345 [Morganella morganii]PLA34587.1 hypothetical protein CYJ97_08620 [Morganella morganii]